MHGATSFVKVGDTWLPLKYDDDSACPLVVAVLQNESEPKRTHAEKEVFSNIYGTCVPITRECARVDQRRIGLADQVIMMFAGLCPISSDEIVVRGSRETFVGGEHTHKRIPTADVDVNVGRTGGLGLRPIPPLPDVHFDPLKHVYKLVALEPKAGMFPE
jgi:hypothetical protein